MRASGWLFSLAAMAVLSLTGGALRAQNQGERGFPYGDLKEVTLQGKLIDLREEMARKYGAKVLGGGAEKQWALALPEGQLYTFLDTAGYRKLAGAKLEGQAVEVQARHFPRSSLLEILSFRPLPPESIKRRFYCNVCAIHADDWGPCACCGLEMKTVAEQP